MIGRESESNILENRVTLANHAPTTGISPESLTVICLYSMADIGREKGKREGEER